MKISVITVCYNAANTLEQTMLSVLNQTYPDVEYIIIDGGSTDGSVDIIKKYADRLAYWVSEPDKGIYDAMNKGIKAATGEWINFMNAGDYFSSFNVLMKIFEEDSWQISDILYGNSTILIKNKKIFQVAGSNVSQLSKGCIYRHGASFVRTQVHREYLFDLSKSSYLGYALDYDVIFRLYKAGKIFRKLDVDVISFQEDGVSNHPFMNCYYVYKITSENHFSFIPFCRMVLRMVRTAGGLLKRKILN